MLSYNLCILLSQNHPQWIIDDECPEHLLDLRLSAPAPALQPGHLLGCALDGRQGTWITHDLEVTLYPQKRLCNY